MIIKNRKLVRRDDLGPIADYIDLDRLKADAEVAMLEVPDDAWGYSTAKGQYVSSLFDWSYTSQGYDFWYLVNNLFTGEPLVPDTDRLAEIDADIDRLTAEREKLMQGETR